MTDDAIWPSAPRLLTEEAEALRRERDEHAARRAEFASEARSLRVQLTEARQERDEARAQLREHAGAFRRGFEAGWDWSVSLRGDAPARELEEQRLVAAGLANELALVRAAADGDARRAEAIARVAALLRELDRSTCTTFDGHAVRQAIAILEGVERG